MARNFFAVMQPDSQPVDDSGKPWGPGVVEVLYEGPAGTGKTLTVLLTVNKLCEDYHGCQVLFLRDTRVSLNDSVLQPLEDDVIGPDSPVLLDRDASKETRSEYKYPNGSRIVPGGLDKIDRYRSTAWDVIIFFEATESKSAVKWNKLIRGCRGKALPNHRRYIVADTNPDHPQHWLNLRGRRMVRLRAKHTDNPRWYDQLPAGGYVVTPDGAAYIASLDAMDGHVRAWYRDGLWVAAEGMIWPEYSPAVHLIPRSRVPLDPPLSPIIASVDWGYRAPGCIQLWAFDHRGTMYRIHETYMSEQTPEWWVGRAMRLHRQHRPTVWVCDPEDAGRIASFRAAGLPCIEAVKNVEYGIARVKDRLKVNPLTGEPRLYFVDDALDEVDPKLSAAEKPRCTEQEITGYVYPEAKEGKKIDERPDQANADHGCDCTRYAVMFADGAGLKSAPKTGYAPGTLGAIMGHDEDEGNSGRWVTRR